MLEQFRDTSQQGVAVSLTGSANERRRRLSARYNRIIYWTVSGVLSVAATLVYLEAESGLRAEKARLTESFHDEATALQTFLEKSVDEVRILGLEARHWLRVNPQLPPTRSPLLGALANSPGDLNFDLDTLPPGWSRDDTGNLTGRVGSLDNAALRELEMAVSLNGLLAAIRSTNPSVAWTYYTSARGFQLLYPWVGSRNYRYDPDGPQQEYLQLGRPEVDPARAPFWTSAYLDAAGAGMMVTVAMPVDEGSVFRGTVAADLTLNTLNRFVRDWHTNLGVALLMNERGQLLASSDKRQPVQNTVANARDLLPAALRSDMAAILSAAESGQIVRNGYYIEALRIANTPFRLVLLAPRLHLVWSALQGTVFAMLLLVAGLTPVLVLTHRLTRREFVKPAEQLVRFIEDESRGRTPVPLHVHPGWAPWFATIRRAFDSHVELVSIRQELDVARRIQRSIVPTSFPEHAGLDLFGRMTPAREVGGDFFDFFWLDQHRIGISIGDVSGKGVPAALFMAVARTLLRATGPAAGSPARCLAMTNDVLSQDNESLMFVTVFHGVLDLRNGVLTYANAGHNSPYIIDQTGRVTRLSKPDGMALGVSESEVYGEHSVRLVPESSLLLYTDGVPDALNRNEEEFTETRLQEAIHGIQHISPEALVNRVSAAVDAFVQGAPQQDDITLLALHLRTVPKLAS